MLPELRLTLAQIDVHSLAPERNLERIDRVCRAAAAARSQLVVFPELANIGQVRAYDRQFTSSYLAAAEALSGLFVTSIQELARDLSIYVVVGLAERHPLITQTVFNTAVVIGAGGQLLAIQRKLHLPGEERHYFGVGDRIEVVQTDLGVISVQICYDLYFPEVARIAGLRGAEVLIGVANIPHRPSWPDRISQLASVRAYENMHYVAISNRIGTDQGVEYGGESVVAAPPGRILDRCPALTESAKTVELCGDTILSERARRPVFADRRPELYSEISWPLIAASPRDGNG